METKTLTFKRRGKGPTAIEVNIPDNIIEGIGFYTEPFVYACFIEGLFMARKRELFKKHAKKVLRIKLEDLTPGQIEALKQLQLL